MCYYGNYYGGLGYGYSGLGHGYGCGWDGYGHACYRPCCFGRYWCSGFY
ncbi:keratin-associated protein 20-2-like [Enhydra lutris kenyoni]|uniref:Keratin-associated protein 20-2-like n=1 Tax=Enhydra lutris kenyoni TaxID=391180 RepID=A0A2Y9KQX5_ENHLU|nr:keratin-associated protein 20-2-like [Enhydra lutris kenyoni]XP_022371625.1 keratin-associated protein 20-2-like [Enhydra lutris kenyoni]